MKKTFLLSALAFLSVALVCSCQRSGRPDPDPVKTIVTGKIINRDVYPDHKTVTIKVQDFRGTQSSRGQGIQYVDTIRDDGTFRIEFDLFITQDIAFDPKVGSLIARPGDSIYIDIDFRNIGTMNFSGDFAKANEDYRRYVRSYYALDYYRNAGNINDDLSFLLFCDSVREVMYAKREEYIKERDPEGVVINWAGQFIDIQHSLVIFNRVFRNLQMSRSQGEEWIMPQEYEAAIHNMAHLFNDSLMTSNAYTLIRYLLTKQTWNHYNDMDSPLEEILHHMVNDVTGNNSNELFRELLTGAVFYQDLANNNAGFFENNPELFTKYITRPFISEPLAMYYANVKYHNENPEIRHYKIMDRLGNSPGRVLLDSLLDAHKGKVVYIDFWATWCGPCIEAMPGANKMVQQYAGENIEFVFLCMGVDENQWAEIIRSLDMGGVHHYTGNRQEINSLMSGFQIMGIPYYALVNQAGYLIDSGNHLSPGSPVTLGKINDLVNNP